LRHVRRVLAAGGKDTEEGFSTIHLRARVGGHHGVEQQLPVLTGTFSTSVNGSRGNDVVAVDRLGPREGPVLQPQQPDDAAWGTERIGTFRRTQTVTGAEEFRPCEGAEAARRRVSLADIAQRRLNLTTPGGRPPVGQQH
jgi:hypothetical protein